MGFTGFYRVLMGFTGFYWVLLGLKEFKWVLLGSTGLHPHVRNPPQPENKIVWRGGVGGGFTKKWKKTPGPYRF